MFNRAAIFFLLCLLATGNALAGMPPIVNPDMPPDWSWQQKGLAKKALDVLFDTCPAIDTYLTDIESISLYVDDMAEPINAQFAPKFFKDHQWRKVMLVVVSIIPKPTNKTLAKDVGRAGIDIDFYMGSGNSPGVYLETDQKMLCGNPHAQQILVTRSVPEGIDNDFETYIPAEKLSILNDL